ncbi:hypothetical protein JG687_00017714 [Phytophthora cactorum]|uniref:Uncharacterized protein n=1 Tax=Phytophthora cactorum TaxID=29920 RepID=A0A8T1TNL4_9STRA|nr:hypothetical protein PC120_g24832 [Phytophthora cactorum]KAG3042971.1 hypothetical protein PC121_g22838 [Phytophthora cactorum]KAG3127139.1 hypothetical protein PC128_g27131 [Phytophthora cactorum]KAG4039125.1 hypothetical protein PC123_g25319 [Phytophthora cactorum]KAG6944695.1 hypothetical protein JG687_00017714 [Phytophthora cactorum]
MYRRTAIAYVHMKLVLDYIAEGHDLDETILRFYRLNKNRSKKKQINKWLKCEVRFVRRASLVEDLISMPASFGTQLFCQTCRAAYHVVDQHSTKEGVFVSWSMLSLQAKEVVSDIGQVKTCLQLQARG